MRLIAIVGLLLLHLPAVARGQVELVGGDGAAAAEVVRDLLARGQYQVVDRDTTLSEAFYAPGDLVVLGADVRLEGRVGGSVAVIDGAFFLRPGAQVGGGVATLGGEFLRSGLAGSGEHLSLPPGTSVRVTRVSRGYLVEVTDPPGPPVLRLDGVLGVGLPAYNRVDGVTLRYGARATLRGLRTGAEARVTGLYHAERGEPGGVATLEVPVAGGYVAVLEALHATRTNEDWIRGEVENSLSALLVRSDVRNYYESSAVSLTFVRRPTAALVVGEGFVGPFVAAVASRDRSLAAGDPWSLLGGDPWRANPAITAGTLISATAGVAGEWRGVASRFTGRAAIEWAPPSLGNFEFVQSALDARWEMVGLWGHLLGVQVHSLVSAGPDGAPPQRWSYVGGPGTLPTEPVATLAGDRLVFVESSYVVPLRRVALPLLGPPDFQLLHAVGAAWRTDGPSPRWEQNLGAGLQLHMVRAALYVNPGTDGLDPTFHLSAQLPF